MARVTLGAIVLAAGACLASCWAGDEPLPVPHKDWEKRAIERGRKAPDIHGLYRAVLEHASHRAAPASGLVPLRVCVDVGAPEPENPDFPTTRDVELLRGRGLPVSVGALECLHREPRPALYVAACAPERWWNDPDEYEVALVTMYDTGTATDEDIRLLVVVAVQSESGWQVRRDEVRELPPDAYALGRRTRG